MPSLADQPLLLLAYTQPDNALLNDEFWWLAVTKPIEILLEEVSTIFGDRNEWRRQLEEAPSSGITIHELEGIRRVPVSLGAWVIGAEDVITAVRTIAHTLGECNVPPELVISESSQITPSFLDLTALKVGRQPFLNRCDYEGRQNWQGGGEKGWGSINV